VNPIVSRQLGVESDHEQIVLTRRHRMTIHLGEDLHVRAVLGDPRRADENRPQRASCETAHVEVGLERTQLTSERVALRTHVHQTEMLTIEHNQPCTRSQHWRPAAHQLAQRLTQPLAGDAERHRRGLAPRDHQPFEALQVTGRAHLAHIGAQPPQDTLVCLEPALQGEHTHQW
jgi:hypothetical protein